MAWEFAPFACYWWSFAFFYLCRGGLVGPCPPAHAGTVCFDIDLGYFRRGGGAARVSGPFVEFFHVLAPGRRDWEWKLLLSPLELSRAYRGREKIRIRRHRLKRVGWCEGCPWLVRSGVGSFYFFIYLLKQITYYKS